MWKYYYHMLDLLWCQWILRHIFKWTTQSYSDNCACISKTKLWLTNLCKPSLLLLYVEQLNKLWVYYNIVLFQIVILLPVCPMQQFSTMLPHTSTPPLTAVLSDTTKQKGTQYSPATQLAAGPGTKWNAPSTVSSRSDITKM